MEKIYFSQREFCSRTSFRDSNTFWLLHQPSKEDILLYLSQLLSNRKKCAI